MLGCHARGHVEAACPARREPWHSAATERSLLRRGTATAQPGLHGPSAQSGLQAAFQLPAAARGLEQAARAALDHFNSFSCFEGGVYAHKQNGNNDWQLSVPTCTKLTRVWTFALAEVAGALANLCALNARCQDSVGECGAAAVLVRLLKVGGTDVHHAPAAAALASLCFDNARNQDSVRACGGAAALEGVLACAGSAAAHKWAAAALTNLGLAVQQEPH
jgi:hypothetical protein